MCKGHADGQHGQSTVSSVLADYKRKLFKGTLRNLNKKQL